MKLIQHVSALVCLVATLTADEPTEPNPKCATTTALDGQNLQGRWEGFQVGEREQTKIVLTIAGDSLNFYRDTNFWFKTTFTLQGCKTPKQLHATIKETPERSSIGEVVNALFKNEQGTLVLATTGNDADDTTKSFEASGARYEFRKVRHQFQNAPPSKLDAESTNPPAEKAGIKLVSPDFLFQLDGGAGKTNGK